MCTRIRHYVPVAEDNPHNLERGHRETKLNRNWKLYSSSLAFILLKGSVQTVGEEKGTTIASSCKPYAPQYWSAWHEVVIGAIAVWMFCGLPTTFRSDLRPILLEEIYAGTVELVKSLWLGRSQRPYEVYIIKILPNGQMVYEYLCLFSQSSTAFILGQMQSLEHMLDGWPVNPFHTNKKVIV